MKILFVLGIITLFLITACTGQNITGGTTIINQYDKMKTATIETDKGTIKFELFEDKAPITTKNFIELAQKGFYDGLTFHRVIQNWFRSWHS